MPPSLSVSVGVPPATVTASLKFERQRDGLAGIEVAARRRLLTSDATSIGAVVSICRAGQGRRQVEVSAALPAPSVMVRR